MATAKKAQTDEHGEIIKDFKDAVNMTASQLERWLGTDESKEVGFKNDDKGESIGHQSGRRIVEMLGKKKDDFTDEDFKFMKKVVGYINRHSAQKPDGDVKETPWRYSLMNWGHDPLKK
jgi:DNA topoisomerase VI subunit B